jgi:hypothetical protein
MSESKGRRGGTTQAQDCMITRRGAHGTPTRDHAILPFRFGERAERPRERSEQMSTASRRAKLGLRAKASEHATREADASGRPEAEREAL